MPFQFPRNTDPDRLSHHVINFETLVVIADEIGSIDVEKFGSVTLEQIQVVLLALELTGMVVSARELEIAQQAALHLKGQLDLANTIIEIGENPHGKKVD